MELSARIDQVMASLEALKVRAADAPAEANSQFASILETALDSDHTTTTVTVAEPNKVQAEAAPQIPGWVDPDYGYDPANPRKPNMRELMEALSGRPVEALYADANSNWQDTSRLASELLYGVVGSNDDTRDWSAIIGSSDIVRAARQATGDMYAPVVDILSITNDAGAVTDQLATINDADGTILRSLTGGAEYVRETLVLVLRRPQPNARSLLTFLQFITCDCGATPALPAAQSGNTSRSHSAAENDL